MFIETSNCLSVQSADLSNSCTDLHKFAKKRKFSKTVFFNFSFKINIFQYFLQTTSLK